MFPSALRSVRLGAALLAAALAATLPARGEPTPEQQLDALGRLESRTRQALLAAGQGRPPRVEPVVDAVGALAKLQADTSPPLGLGPQLEALEPGRPRADRVRALRVIEGRCRELRRALLAPPPPPTLEQQAARVHEILSRREFQAQERQPTWWERVQRRLADALMRVLRRFGIPDTPSSRTTVAAAALGLLLVLLTWLALFTSRRVREGVEVTQRAAAAAVEAGLQPDALLEEARRLADQGDFRGAFERAYVATLAYLDVAGHLRLDTRRTNWEHLRQLQPPFPASARRAMEEATRSFDRKWYGLQPCSREEFERLWLRLEEVRAAAAGTPAEEAVVGAGPLAPEAVP